MPCHAISAPTSLLPFPRNSITFAFENLLTLTSLPLLLCRRTLGWRTVALLERKDVESSPREKRGTRRDEEGRDEKRRRKRKRISISKAV